MNVETYIKEEALKLKHSRRNVEISPEIAAEHFAKIRKKYLSELGENIEKFVLVMSYSSTGIFFMTGDAFYYDNYLQDGLKSIRFSDITAVRAEEGKLLTPDRVVIKTTSGDYALDACIDGVNVHVLESVFNHIIEKARGGEFTVSEQGLLSHQLPEEIKLLYLEILCNYAYVNDSIIDPDEYNAIMKFSIRMELQGDTRAKLRKYMNDSEGRFKTGTLLAGIKQRTAGRTGEWDAVKYCLMQDALLIHNIHSPAQSWREDGFIGSLMEQCSLRTEQIDSMVKAVVLNNKMTRKDAEMDKIKSEWKSLIKSIKGTVGYVPTPYLFCSGSVYGLKSYDGFLKKDEISQKAINKQRELILQEIIINNQKTVNVLIGDMNYLAEKLENALMREEEIEQDYDKINQLLCRIKSAMRNVKQNEECEDTINENVMVKGSY